MKIETSWISRTTGKKAYAYYEECNNFFSLPKEKMKSVCAFCYLDGKFVIVKNRGRWEPVAGHMEVGESPEETLVREVKEESNMKVLEYFPIGYLYTHGEDIFQPRYFCIVEPYGPFISDPDGDVSEIKLIDADEILKYIGRKDTSLLMKDKCLQILKSKGY